MNIKFLVTYFLPIYLGGFPMQKYLLLLVFLFQIQGLFAEVNINLEAFLVVYENGKEVYKPLNIIKPGDIIEYRAEYLNSDRQTIDEVKAILPIPEGMEYLALSAQPNFQIKASLDGNTYSYIPLKRYEVDQYGRLVEVEIPYSEYRFLQWNLGSLQGRSKRVVSARVQVSR